MGYYGPAQDTMHIVLNLPSDTAKLNAIDGMISSVISLGAGIGAIGSIFLLKKLSRRDCLIVTDIISVVGILITLIANLYALMLGRFIMGLGVGFNSALVSLYINEVSPVSISGQMGVMNQLINTSGLVVSYIWGLGFAEQANQNVNYWRIPFAFPIITCLLRIALLKIAFNRDTPKYYVKSGDEEKAKDAIAAIY